MPKRVKMLKKTHYKMKSGNTTLELDLSRFEKQFQDAQYALDSMVMTDMVPYMPHQTGTFINVTKAMSEALAGSGRVVAAAPPMGRFLYEGKKMVDSQTGKGPMKIPCGPGGEFVWRYREGAKLKPTNQPLNYDKNHNPEVTDHWFDTAKEKYCDNWVKVVKNIAGGGERKV